jgi:hypothetical protein
VEHLTGPWDLVVVGHGFSELSTALSHLQHATSEGRTSRVAVLERAPYEGRGGSRRRPLRQADPYQRALSPHGVRMAGLPICDSSMPSTATARKDSARV